MVEFEVILGWRAAGLGETVIGGAGLVLAEDEFPAEELEWEVVALDEGAVVDAVVLSGPEEVGGDGDGVDIGRLLEAGEKTCVVHSRLVEELAVLEGVEDVAHAGPGLGLGIEEGAGMAIVRPSAAGAAGAIPDAHLVDSVRGLLEANEEVAMSLGTL